MPSNKSVNRLFLITVVIYIGVSLILGRLPGLRLPVSVVLILSEALILIPSLIYLKVKGISVGTLIPFRKMKFSVWVLVVVCTYLMYPLLVVMNALTLFFVKSGTVEMMNAATQGNFLVAALLMAVLPAFAEEFVFRGVIFGTYKRSKMLPAALLSGFLFGCMHLNLNQFLYAFVLGVYMAFLVEATGSILSAMLAHFTVNFTSVVMSYALSALNSAAGDLMEQMGQAGAKLPTEAGGFFSSMDEASLLMMALSLLFWAVISLGTTAGAVGVYIAISKISGRWEYVKGMFRRKTKEQLLTVPVIIAIALAAAMMALAALS